MTNVKLSQITPATTAPATTDQMVSVIGGNTDALVSVSQLATTIIPLLPSPGSSNAFGVIAPETYGALGDGVHDDAPAINAAITAAAAENPTPTLTKIRGVVRLTTGKTYKCNAQILLNPAACGLDMNGAQMNFAGAPSLTPCILIQGPQCGNQWAIKDGTLFGAESNVTPVQTMIGVQCASLEISNVYIQNTGRAIDCSYVGTFLVTIRDCLVEGAYSGFSMVGNPVGSGENMQIYNFSCGTVTVPIDWQNDQGGSLSIYSSSLDYGNSFVQNRAGLVKLTDCHFESNQPVPSGFGGFIQNTGNSSKTVLIRPVLLYSGSNPPPYLCHCTVVEPHGIFILDPKFYAGSNWNYSTFIDDGAGGNVVVQGVYGQPPTVSSLAALRNYYAIAFGGGSPPIDTLVYLKGYTLPNDGGQGTWRWNPSALAADDGGTSINPTWNTGGGGPNLVLNSNFAAGATNWTTSSGTPVFSGNSVHDNGVATYFWQITQTITGLVAGQTYVVSVDYTLTLGSGQVVNVAIGSLNAFNSTPQATPTTWTNNFVATATSMGLVLAGLGGPSSMTNVSVSSAPGGRWLRQIDEPGVAYPEWWGAVGNNSHDDAPAINSAIVWATTYGSGLSSGYGLRGLVKLGPGRIYLCNARLTPINPVAMNMTGQNGASLNFSNIASGNCITIQGASVNGANSPYGNTITVLEGFGLFAFPAQVNTVGIGFSASSGDYVSHLQFEHMFITGFGIGLNLNGANVYAIGIRRLDIFSCGICWCMNSPGSNSGEEMVIEDSALFNSNVCIDMAGGQFGTEVTITNTAIDYSNCFIRVSNGASVRVWGCHFETSFFNSPLVGIAGGGFVTGAFPAIFSCGGSCDITLTSSAIIWTGGNLVPPPFYSATPYPYGITVQDCVWQWNPNSVQPNMTVVGSGLALDPSRSKLTNVALTNNNLTITNIFNNSSASSSATSYANTGILKGLWYFSVTLNAFDVTGSFQVGVGQWIGISGAGLTSQAVACVLQVDANFGPAFNGIWNGSLAFNFTPPVTPGTVFIFAVNYTTNRFWVTWDNGTNWNNSPTGNPSTNTGGAALGQAITNIHSNFPALNFPALGSQKIGDQFTFNFNPSLTGVTGLSGFAPYANAFTLVGGGAVLVQRSKSVFEGWPALQDITNALNADATFEFSTGTAFLDPWYLSQDTVAITSRNTGTNISIAIGTNNPFSGLQELNIVKAGAATTAAAFAIMLPCDVRDNHSYGIQYAASANSLGTFKVNVTYAKLLYFGTGGVPAFGQTFLAQVNTFTPTTTYQSAVVAVIAAPGGSFLTPAPPWATHVLFEFDLRTMAAGTLYIDNAQFYRA